MNKMRLRFHIISVATTINIVAPLNPQGCGSESSLTGRNDVVFCEPWENSNWWQNGYYSTISTTPASEYKAVAEDVANTSVTNTGCISGSCLKVSMKKYQSGALAVHWPLKNKGLAPEQLYMRYYIKLGANFDPNFCDKQGVVQDNGGKFPGLADVRSYPEEQCGNGGAYADGINCWSMRTKYRNCKGSGGAQVCTSPNATTRFGGYVYYPKTSQDFAAFDSVPWGTGFVNGTCSASPESIGNCGLGDAGQFENNKWYLVELFIKMNTPGKSDGAIRGWVNNQLSYEKTNMVWRLPGHKNLHVRTAWLNVHSGGEFGGLCLDSEIYLDQMVLATGSQIGPWLGGK